jgi:hypothetical protein
VITAIIRKFLFVVLMQTCIMHEMFRAEVEPMKNDDRIPRMGLYKVVIYGADRFVRTDKENLTISAAEKLAGDLNYQFGHKTGTNKPKV